MPCHCTARQLTSAGSSRGSSDPSAALSSSYLFEDRNRHAVVSGDNEGDYFLNGGAVNTCVNTQRVGQVLPFLVVGLNADFERTPPYHAPKLRFGLCQVAEKMTVAVKNGARGGRNDISVRVILRPFDSVLGPAPGFFHSQSSRLRHALLLCHQPVAP